MNRRRIHIRCIVLAVAAAAQVESASAAEWELQGSTTLRLETIDNEGGSGSTPYAFEGGHHYLELNARAQRRASLYELTSIQFYGVANDSAYRSRDQGVVPERMSVFHEKGDARVPFRVHVGDFLGAFSYLTTQRSVKGVQVEVQPDFGDDGLHSIMVFSGESENEWRHLSLGEDTFSGLSWSADWHDRGRYLLNYVHNRRDADPNNGVVALDQEVWSLGGEFTLPLPGQSVDLRGEFAWFEGDHAGTTSAPADTDVGGAGLFLEAAGRLDESPLSYTLRGERYDRDYAPAAAIVPAGRQSVEGYATWQFDNGLRLRGRVLNYRDGLDSATVTRNETRGFNLSGPMTLFGRRISQNVDIYQQDIFDNATTDNESLVFNGYWQSAVTDDWYGTLSWFYKNRDDANVSVGDSIENFFKIGASTDFAFGEVNLNINPGIGWREIGGNQALDELFPTLSIRAVMGDHEFSAYYGHQEQERRSPTTAALETITENASIDYRYRWNAHSFGLEGLWYENDVDNQRGTRSNRVSIYWRYDFDDDTVRGWFGRGGAPTTTVSRGVARAPAGAGSAGGLMSLEYGIAMRDVYTALNNRAIRPDTGVPQGRYRIYDARWLGSIDLRQRVVIETVGGTLAGATVIVDFDEIGNNDTAERSYQRVRSELVRRYGTPDLTYEEGQFGSSFVTDVNRQRLIRVDEWRLPGGILRFGIPRRLDGQVRMEIQKREYLPPAQDTLWSIDAVR